VSPSGATGNAINRASGAIAGSFGTRSSGVISLFVKACAAHRAVCVTSRCPQPGCVPVLHGAESMATGAGLATPVTLAHTMAAAANCMNSRLNVATAAISARFR